jgi:thioester reductase-like protein
LAVSFFPMFYEMTLVLVHPDVPLSASYVAQLLKHGVITTMLTPPSILEDLSKDHSSLQNLAKLEHVGFAGGPLQPGVGNKLAAVLPHLFSFLGATECGWFLNIVGDNKVWDSLNFYSDIGYRFDEVSDGLFELVIDKDEQTNKIFRGIFEVFPTLMEYRTKDLYSANPDALGWYTYRGRADDLIVLSNGEKINPIPLENIIRSHPLVRGALVVGEYRFSPSLLLEMENDSIPKAETESHAILDSIWSTVQEANKIAPGFSKIPKSLILFSTAEKPFLRAGKGTIQRQLTVKSYAKELDHMYSSQETGLLIEGLTLADSFSPDNVKTFTNNIYSQALGVDNLKDDEDIFLRGMDSLGVSVVVQRLQAALKSCGASLNLSEINPRLIYSAPSVDRTTEALVHLVSTNASLHPSSGNGASRQTKLQSMLEKYWSNIPSASLVQQRSGADAWKIILTGTTGSLGTHLLATLEAMPVVAKIFCLNRSSNARERQKKMSQSHGLNFDWDDRVEFLHTNLSKSKLGLNAEKYDELLRETTVVIHNAWQVDFNLAIESFEPQIRGLRNLLDFSFHSSNKVPVIFTSSISTAIEWMEQHPDDLVPEAVIHDFDAPQKIGYAESKFVSEHVLETFSKSSGLTTAIFRTGQIAGPLTGKGVWNGREWFPSIMSSSKHLDILPETLGKMESIEWIPVDVLSSIMVELVEEVLRSQSLSKTLVYNLVNPKAATWSSLLKSAQKVTGISKTVPLKDWVEAVEASSREKNGAIIETNPAVKLLDWLRIISQSQERTSGFEVGRLVQDSRTASQLTAVTLEWMSLWISRLKL